MTATSLYSGIVLNQNVTPSGSDDLVTNLTPPPGGGLYPSPSLFPSSSLFPSRLPISQTFVLGDAFPRADSSVIPSLTGVQLYTNILPGLETEAITTWELDVSQAGVWTRLASGMGDGAPIDGDTWLNLFFPTAVPVEPEWLTSTFRLTFGGFDRFWFSSPNPLLLGQAFWTDDTPVLDDGLPLSLMFRVLADVVDEGTDFLGNVYRSALATSTPAAVTPVTSDTNSGWLSAPSPSHFAVQSLYYDERVNGDAVVVDRLTLDPLTPGMYFTVYYSNDAAGPGTDPTSWDALLWTPVYKTFQANRKDTYALPNPIIAKYFKVEFTNLQPRSYDPGAFQLPSTFHKYPKWVLDYFLARFAVEEHDFLSTSIAVTYDALDLAYTYYEGDLTQTPDPPALSQTPLTSAQIGFLQQQNLTDQIDPTTLAQIRTVFQPYTSQPALLGNLTSVLGSYAASAASANYPVETISPAQADTSIVSSLQREALIVEKGFPVMFFFVPCRHTYRLSQATFEKNIGYFAGVKELVWHRDVYTQSADQAQYNEPLGDFANLMLHDASQPPSLPR